jgi:hypothetical protein
MVRFLNDFFGGQSATRLGAIIAALLVLITAWNNRREIRLALLRVWYEFPLIGRLARLSRDLNRSAQAAGWYNSEWELCNAFYAFFPRQEANLSYRKATSYLQKAQQVDRRETPWFFWIVIFGLLFAEAGSFGLLVTVFVAPTSATQDQNLYGWIAAFVFAVVMLVITHRAGHEQFVNMLRSRVRDLRRSWFELHPDAELKTPRLLALDASDGDDGDASWLQLANRVDGGLNQRYQPSYLFRTAAVGFVIFFAVTTFLLRDALFQQLQESASFNLGPRGPLLAFGILSAIFMALQVVSCWLGYHYGFAGLVARQAANIRGRYPSEERFQMAQENERGRIDRIAQNMLTRLQNNMMDQDPIMAKTNAQVRTFLYFCVLRGDEQALKDLQSLSGQNQTAGNLSLIKQATGFFRRDTADKREAAE